MSFLTRSLSTNWYYWRQTKRRRIYAPTALYCDLHARYRRVQHPEMERLEGELGFQIEPDFLDDLALHLQVTKKSSELNWQHGRMLYSLLRRYVHDASRAGTGDFRILETGTARGFSAMCMSRALADSGASGCIMTVDRLPHDVPMLWNCIDDRDGPKTRASLLSPWSVDRDRCVYLSGKSGAVLSSLGVSRIHFAFLDAEHTKKAVLEEYNFVAARQVAGDIVVFDDVTPNRFPGIVDAVAAIEGDGRYSVERILVSEDRGYAIARRGED